MCQPVCVCSVCIHEQCKAINKYTQLNTNTYLHARINKFLSTWFRGCYSHAYLLKLLYACMYVCMYVCTCVQVKKWCTQQICVYIYIHVFLHTYMFACMYVCMSICTLVLHIRRNRRAEQTKPRIPSQQDDKLAETVIPWKPTGFRVSAGFMV